MPLPTIPSGNVASALGGTYEVANSCRFNDGDSSYMHKTLGSDGNKRTWTFSAWIKRSVISATQYVWGYRADGNNRIEIGFHSNNQIVFKEKISGTTNIDFTTTAVYRDSSAWLHLVVAVDTEQGTESNRVKIYVNGTQITSWTDSNYPDEDHDTANHVSGRAYNVGREGASYFDGYLAEVCMIDGLQLAPTSFGEFDEDSPTIWKPINVSGLTFGTHGFYLDFEDSANLGNDANGGTDLTEVNLAATDQSTDTPTNSFATLNPLDYWSNSSAAASTFLSEGNLDYDVGSSAKGLIRSTIGVTSAKWYWEIKNNTVSKGFYGICNANALNGSTSPHDASDYRGIFFYDAVPDFRANTGDGAITTGVASISNGNILNFALDMDNYAFYIGINGTWMNSGNPTSGASKTGAISELFTNGSTYLSDYGEVFACLYCSSTSGSIDASANFGSPSFAISSSNSDANGYGSFEHSIPSGYFSLNSKNLAEYGG